MVYWVVCRPGYLYTDVPGEEPKCVNPELRVTLDRLNKLNEKMEKLHDLSFGFTQNRVTKPRLTRSCGDAIADAHLTCLARYSTAPSSESNELCGKITRPPRSFRPPTMNEMNLHELMANALRKEIFAFDVIWVPRSIRSLPAVSFVSV